VPNLIQSTEDRAVALLELYRLAVEIEPVFSEDVEPGRVVSQSPAPDAEVEEGHTVVIRVSKGPEDAIMPDLVNITVDNAREQLQLLDVTVEETEQGSEAVPAGFVIAQDPPAGTEVEAGSTVRLTVSKGIERVAVPDVSGEFLALAIQQLSTVGLRGMVGITLDKDPGTCGTVASQNPQPGEPAETGATVTLNVRGLPGCTPSQ
jgi:serine/threonine-protein kinase